MVRKIRFVLYFFSKKSLESYLEICGFVLKNKNDV